MNRLKNYLAAALMVCCAVSYAKTYRVASASEFNASAKSLVAGDSMVMAPGVWKDAVLVVGGEGSAEKPITVMVEQPQKTSIEGLSSLTIFGKYLVVDGLVFINGCAPKDYVIQFRKDDKQRAYNCTLRNCVIDNFSKPNRTDEDRWISMWGQHNTIENCYFGGKLNAGPTFVVWPNGEGNDKNFHHIYRNYFGARPRLGSNGGETMRIGTSDVSLGSSNTLVEGNYFEHCDGEVEIISVKSCDNIIRANTFYECEGSVVLRHGNRNEVSGNYFIGNNKPYTGGVRVINEGHKIFNNYFVKLAGTDMRGPLCVMSGVPNSPLNRYAPVKDVEISFNTWIDCPNTWHLSYGSDAERSALPQSVTIANNLVFSTLESPVVKTYDKIEGFAFKNNLLWIAGKNATSYGSAEGSASLARGTSGLPMAVTQTTGVGFDYVTKDIEGRSRPAKKTVGAIETSSTAQPSIEAASAKNCGPQWKYTPIGQEVKVLVAPGKTISVEPGENTLYNAIKKSAPGDVLLLKAGNYVLRTKTVIPHSLTIKAADDAVQKAVISSNSASETSILFEVSSGVEFRLVGVTLTGESTGTATKYAIATSKEMNRSYSIYIDNCLITKFKNSNGGCVIKTYKGTFGEIISITNSQVVDCIRGLALNDEKDEKGLYSAENVVISNSVFKDIEQWAIDFLRGGNDESTLGGNLKIDHCVFDNVNNKEAQYMIRQTGLVNMSITNSIFYNTLDAKGVVRLIGTKHTMENCNVYDVEKPKATAGATLKNISFDDPKFEKKTLYKLSPKSPLLKKASDGGNIGLIN